MIITEPMTLLTDYLIAIQAIGFAVLLGQKGRSLRQRSMWLWAATFGFVGLAAFLGGTCHGFVTYLGNERVRVMWQIMVYCLGIASYLMLAATVTSVLPRRIQVWVLLGFGVKSVLYLSWAAYWMDNYAYSIANYLSAMAIVLLLQGWAIHQGHHVRAARWIVGGIIVSGLAVAVQSTGMAIGQHFNHNDIYHVIQMVGLYLFYRGANQLKDR
ncbi:DUF6962 family protein [Egbenema bharatensis]|uniref:DUF6962 family protein n=1 Tax=Egbenema bharatensis TaxID=3463334 RepID=UPI003A8A3E66